MLNKISESFRPHESFLKLNIVKNTIWAFLLISFVIVFLIIYTGGDLLYLDLSFKGFNKALEIFKAPLGLMAVLLAIIAFYSSQHRAEQVLFQMKLTQEQNIFTNFYKHQEEFLKYIEELESKDSIDEKRLLYVSVYDQAMQGCYTPSKKLNNTLNDSCFEWIESMISVYQNRNEYDVSKLIRIQANLVSSFWGELFLNEDKFPKCHEFVEQDYNKMVINTISQIQSYEAIYKEIILFNASPEIYKNHQLKITNAEHFSTFTFKVGAGTDCKWRDKVTYKLLCEMRDTF